MCVGSKLQTSSCQVPILVTGVILQSTWRTTYCLRNAWLGTALRTHTKNSSNTTRLDMVNQCGPPQQGLTSIDVGSAL